MMKVTVSTGVMTLVFATAFSALAETLTWSGPNRGGYWDDAANWKIDGEPAGRVPQEGDDVKFGINYCYS